MRRRTAWSNVDTRRTKGSNDDTTCVRAHVPSASCGVLLDHGCLWTWRQVRFWWVEVTPLHPQGGGHPSEEKNSKCESQNCPCTVCVDEPSAVLPCSRDQAKRLLLTAPVSWVIVQIHELARESSHDGGTARIMGGVLPRARVSSLVPRSLQNKVMRERLHIATNEGRREHSRSVLRPFLEVTRGTSTHDTSQHQAGVVQLSRILNATENQKYK